VDQRAAQVGALLHAARQLPGILVLEALEADLGEQGARLVLVRGLVLTQLAPVRLDDLQRQHDVLQRGAPRQQRRCLEGHADDRDRLSHLVPGDRDVAFARRQQAGDQLHQRGFAATGRTDHRDKLPFLDLKRGLLQGQLVTLLVAQAHAVELDETGQKQAFRWVCDGSC
jgi:hypothetical protein